jgi:hypothetical protein
VGFNVTDQSLIRFSALTGYLENNGSTMREYISYSYTSKKAHDTVRKEVLYNILLECEVTMKLVRLTKMCLNDP